MRVRERVEAVVAVRAVGHATTAHRPCADGTNENINGLLRQYWPRGLDVATVTDMELDATALESNERPRETRGWLTPAEKFSELVATSA